MDFPFIFAFRGELEARAEGNLSWNTHVDYRRELEHFKGAAELHALYEQAGLDFDADLKMLNESARISADPAATEYLERNIVYNGKFTLLC